MADSGKTYSFSLNSTTFTLLGTTSPIARTHILIVNNGPNPISMGFGLGSSGGATPGMITIPVGGSYERDNPPQSDVSAIGVGGVATVAYTEW